MRRVLKLAAGLGAAAILAGIVTFHPSRPLYMRQRALDVVAPDGVVLRATLSLPRWRSAPFAAMVIVHGSGPLARQDLVGDVRRLVRQGFAVLAYDKRGAGESGGVYPRGWGGGAEAILRLLAADAAAAFSKTREQPEIDPARVGFFGASQASWIIPLAAESLDRKPRFHVILSGAAVSTGVEQFYSDLTGDGHRPPQVADREEVLKLVNAFDGDPGFDPLPVLAGLKIPTLWLLGDRDESVPVFATARVLQSLPPDAATWHTVIRFPDADHSLRDVGTGKAAPVWSTVASWMAKIGVR
ncbi:MAG TPA: alpha/beta hydrolase [Candidatus Polarisedimenticolia bacterium]|nr:alpha/beta hydrolase [Candidatus Polarisedimenticolia bacterium]